MAKDFRELLVEDSRHDVFGRFFKEVQVGMKVVISFQASATHACDPAETLDDVYAYRKWEISLRQTNKSIAVPGVGAWSQLKNFVWAKKFDLPEFQSAMLGELLTVREAQDCFEDVVEYAIRNKQLESEDDIHSIDVDENLKRKKSGCGGCGGGKPKAKKAKKSE